MACEWWRCRGVYQKAEGGDEHEGEAAVVEGPCRQRAAAHHFWRHREERRQHGEALVERMRHRRRLVVGVKPVLKGVFGIGALAKEALAAPVIRHDVGLLVRLVRRLLDRLEAEAARVHRHRYVPVAKEVLRAELRNGVLAAVGGGRAAQRRLARRVGAAHPPAALRRGGILVLRSGRRDPLHDRREEPLDGVPTSPLFSLLCCCDASLEFIHAR